MKPWELIRKDLREYVATRIERVPANLTLVGDRAEAFKAAAELLREIGPEHDDDELAFEARLGEELFVFDWYAGGGFPVLLCWRRGTDRVVFASVEHVRALTPAAAELLEALR